MTSKYNNSRLCTMQLKQLSASTCRHQLNKLTCSYGTLAKNTRCTLWTAIM